MNWIEVRVHTTNEAIEPISHILHENGASGVAIYDSLEVNKKREGRFGEIYELDTLNYPKSGVYIKAYLTEKEATNEKITDIKNKITTLASFGIDITPNDVALKEVREEDWATAWKQYYKPVSVTENISIVPKWEEYEKKHDKEILIWMDPGMAFGTGTHPTTALSLQNLEKYLKEDDIVFDIGCGSGILSIAAAKLGAKEIFAFDLDEVAIESSLYNISLNDTKIPIHVTKNDLIEGVTVKANLIVANILADVIVALVDDAYDALEVGGTFITSGIIDRKETLVSERLKEAGFEIIETLKMDNWVSITAQKV